MAARRSSSHIILAVLVFTLLFALLFQYRILSLAKRLGASVNPIGTKLPITFDIAHASVWLAPIYQTVDYLNTVWFTTVLGLFIAGATAAFLTPYLSRLRGDGLKPQLLGAALGLPNMFCTCCAAGTVAGLRQAKAGAGPALAFFVASPALNMVVLILAFEMLPLKLAVARVVLGLVAAVLVTGLVARLAPDKATPAVAGPANFAVTPPPVRFPLTWLRCTWDITKHILPLLILGLFIVSILKTLLPFEVIAKQFGPGLGSTLLAASIGTVLMVPTFTEVVWAKEFIGQGMAVAPAVALLITLPAVSFPSLWVLGKVFRSYKMAVYLGLSIILLGVLGGLVVSAI